MEREEDEDFEELVQQVDEEMGLEEIDSIPLSSSQDAMILMHRDVHFGGRFDLMLDYYAQEKKGCQEEFEIENIERLMELEREAGEDLAPLVLSGPEAERVGEAKALYRDLRDLYEAPGENELPRLIADLILSEEEEPQEEIEALVAYGKEVVPFLVDLLKSDRFHDPLFPGYGEAPRHAAKSLGQIGDPAALQPLFEMIVDQEFGEEAEVIEALFHLGKPAQEFLMRVVASRPITRDNERAAVALAHFSEEEEVAAFAFQQLQDSQVWEKEALALHLIWCCEGLKREKKRELAAWAEHQKLTPLLKEEISYTLR